MPMTVLQGDRSRWCLLAVALILVSTISCACGPASQDREGGSRAAPSVDFATKTKCADRAEAILSRERSIDSPSNGINAFVRSEQFTYNRSLNTCLVYFEVVEFGAGITYNIVDTLTNRTLYHHVSYGDPKTQQFWDEACKPDEGCLSEVDLRKKRGELFDNQK